jgi:hypothetical protein
MSKNNMNVYEEKFFYKELENERKIFSSTMCYSSE